MARSPREIHWSAILADFRRTGMTHVRLCQNPSETVTDSRSLLQPWDLPGRCVSSAIVPVSAKVKFRPRPPNGHAAASAYIGSS